jgi:putative Mn2+ efflux pump MntP
MYQLFLGSLLLSLIHATIPSHWLPVVAIGKAEKWSQRDTLLVTAISGFAHTISTVLVGIAIGIVGISLSRNYAFIAEKLAPVLLIVLGIIYLIIDRFNHHHHHLPDNQVTGARNRSKMAIILSLVIAMFFSPCLEIEAFYLQAVVEGWYGILLLSAVYIIVTVSGMVLLVFLASKGVRSIQSHFLDHHEKLLSGLVLVILGIIALVVHF